MQAIGQSFPSGHSVSAAIICCFLGCWIINKVKNKWLRGLLISLLALFIILVVFSRMYLGQHYLSDTIAGIVLGTGYSIIAFFILKKRSKN